MDSVDLTKSQITPDELSKYLEILQQNSKQEIENIEDVMKDRQKSSREEEEQTEGRLFENNFPSNTKFSNRSGYIVQGNQFNLLMKRFQEDEQKQQMKLDNLKKQEREKEKLAYEQACFKMNQQSREILKMSQQEYDTRKLSQSFYEIHEKKLKNLEEKRALKLIEQRKMISQSFTFTPHIDERSRQLAENQKRDLYTSTISIENTQKYRDMNEIQKEEANKILQECSFTPKINSRSVSIIRNLKDEKNLKNTDDIHQYINEKKYLSKIYRLKESVKDFSPQINSRYHLKETQRLLMKDLDEKEAIDLLYHQIKYQNKINPDNFKIYPLTAQNHNRSPDQQFSQRKNSFINTDYDNNVNISGEDDYKTENDPVSFQYRNQPVKQFSSDDIPNMFYSPEKSRAFNSVQSTNYNTTNFNSEQYNSNNQINNINNYNNNSFTNNSNINNNNNKNSSQSYFSKKTNYQVIQEETDAYNKNKKNNDEKSVTFLQKNVKEFQNLLQGVALKSQTQP